MKAADDTAYVDAKIEALRRDAAMLASRRANIALVFGLVGIIIGMVGLFMATLGTWRSLTGN